MKYWTWYNRLGFFMMVLPAVLTGIAVVCMYPVGTGIILLAFAYVITAFHLFGKP